MDNELPEVCHPDDPPLSGISVGPISVQGILRELSGNRGSQLVLVNDIVRTVPFITFLRAPLEADNYQSALYSILLKSLYWGSCPVLYRICVHSYSV